MRAFLRDAAIGVAIMLVVAALVIGVYALGGGG